MANINGTNGNDTLTGTASSDDIRAGLGNDTVYGGAGNDVVQAGAGDDTVYAGDGNDLVAGGTGVDLIYGGAGDDRLYGRGELLVNQAFTFNVDQTVNGTGPLNQIGGWDVAHGSSGSVQIVVENGREYVTMSNNGAGTATGWSSLSQSTGITYNGAETYTFSATAFYPGTGVQTQSTNIILRLYVRDSQGNLTLVGESKDAPYTGVDATNYPVGYEVTNTLPAASTAQGELVVQVYQSPDVGTDVPLKLFSTNLSTTDPAAYEDAGNTIYGEAGNDVIAGGLGDDVFYGGAGNDLIFGAEGNDTIDGGVGNDIIGGGFGSDTVTGGDGNDIMYGDGERVNPIENNGTFTGGLAANGWTTSNGSTGTATVVDDYLKLDTGGFPGSYGGVARVVNNVGEIYNSSQSYTVDLDYWSQYDTDEPNRFVVRIYVVDDAGVGTQIGTYIAPGATSTTEAGAQHLTYTLPPSTALAAYDGQELKLMLEAWANNGEGIAGQCDTEVNNVVMTSTDPLFGTRANVDSPTGGNDILDGGLGDDEIYGMGGDDLINGGGGDNVLYGNAGRDSMTVGYGDAAYGGADADYIFIDPTMVGSNNKVTVDGGSTVTAGGGSEDYDVLKVGHVAKHSYTGVTTDADGNSTSGVLNVTYTDGKSATINFSEIESIILTCFTRGVQIETKSGLVAVETLKEGDLVRTKDNGFQPIRWVSARAVDKATLAENAKLYPVKIAAGALGANLPSADLIVSPQHRVLVRSKFARRLFGYDEVLVSAKDLVELEGIEYVTEFDEVEYFHIMFDQHEIVYSNGAETESLFAGPEALKGIAPEIREELLTLYPELDLGSDKTCPVPARMLIGGSDARVLASRHAKKSESLYA